jgi:hypothetical protein
MYFIASTPRNTTQISWVPVFLLPDYVTSLYLISFSKSSCFSRYEIIPLQCTHCEVGRRVRPPKRPKVPYPSSKFLLSTESLSKIFKSSMRKRKTKYKYIDPNPEWKKTPSNVYIGGYKNMKIVTHIIKRQLRWSGQVSYNLLQSSAAAPANTIQFPSHRNKGISWLAEQMSAFHG